jgi:hypothetical protein
MLRGFGRPTLMQLDSDCPFHAILGNCNDAELTSPASEVIDDVSLGCLCEMEYFPDMSVALVVFGTQSVH